MRVGEFLQFRAAHHLPPVRGDDLAQQRGPAQPGQPAQLHARFGVARPLPHAAGLGQQRQDVPRPRQVGGVELRIGQRADGARPIVRTDPGGRPALVVDADQEGRAVALGVVRDHQPQPERVRPRLLDGHAQETRGVLEEPGDLTGGGVLGGHDQVAFVLPVLVVDHGGPSRRRRVRQWLGQRLGQRSGTSATPATVWQILCGRFRERRSHSGHRVHSL